jgi:hypothetical protein
MFGVVRGTAAARAGRARRMVENFMAEEDTGCYYSKMRGLERSERLLMSGVEG